MGATSSVVTNLRAMSPLPASVFVDAKLRQGEAMIRLNHELRSSFIKYIKDCRWTGFLDKVDCAFLDKLTQAPRSSSSSPSTWTKFGYKSPHCSGAARSMMSIEESTKLQVPATTRDDDMRACSCLLFHRNGLRAVIIAILLPHFLISSGSDTCESSLTEDWRNEENTECFYQQIKVAPVREERAVSSKRGRMHEWLVGAVAKFTKSELDEFLADCNASWTRDLLRAMQSLPASVTLSAVDAPNQESRIVYSNFGKAGTGANMHDIYSTDCSPGGADQVTSAIFGAKKYKRCLTSYDGTCRLRALKPVFDANEEHVYTLGLESKPFKDPVLLLQDAGNALSEETFQQIEDLLLLVPLLVRNYKCR